MTLAVQSVLWSPDAPAPAREAFRPVETITRPISSFPKPRGCGLWTSTYVGAPQISDWARWCRDEQFGFGTARLWLLTPHADARVFEIDTYEDLEALHAAHGATDELTPEYTVHGIDWESLTAAGYDGVHLTEEGQWRTRLTHPLDLYGWDSESTLWLRWAFDAVADGGVLEVFRERAGATS